MSDNHTPPNYKIGEWIPDYTLLSNTRKDYLKRISNTEEYDRSCKISNCGAVYLQYISNLYSYERLPFLLDKTFYAGWKASGSVPPETPDTFGNILHPISTDLASLFPAQVVGAWMAFEILAKDLWDLAVTKAPTMIQNPEEKLGGIFWIRKSFKDEIKDDIIDAAISDPRLDVLYTIRNLIVHKSGKADTKYLAARIKYPALPELLLGNKLFLDGQTTRQYMEDSEACAKLFITAFNRWLTVNSSDV